MLSSIKSFMGIKPSVAKAAKSVAKEAAVASKPVMEESKGAEALANQGRAMVQKYEKPSMQVSEIKESKMTACSTTHDWEGGGHEPDNWDEL